MREILEADQCPGRPGKRFFCEFDGKLSVRTRDGRTWLVSHCNSARALFRLALSVSQLVHFQRKLLLYSRSNLFRGHSGQDGGGRHVQVAVQQLAKSAVHGLSSAIVTLK